MCVCVRACARLLPGVQTRRGGTRGASGGSPRGRPRWTTSPSTPWPVGTPHWGQQEEWGQRTACCVPGCGPCPAACPALGEHRDVFPPAKQIAKTSCLQSAGRGREGESGLASSLPFFSFKSLLCSTFSTGAGALKSETPPLALGARRGVGV